MKICLMFLLAGTSILFIPQQSVDIEKLLENCENHINSGNVDLAIQALQKSEVREFVDSSFSKNQPVFLAVSGYSLQFPGVVEDFRKELITDRRKFARILPGIGKETPNGGEKWKTECEEFATSFNYLMYYKLAETSQVAPEIEFDSMRQLIGLSEQQWLSLPLESRIQIWMLGNHYACSIAKIDRLSEAIVFKDAEIAGLKAGK